MTILFLAVLSVLGGDTKPAALVLHVAPQGNDAWSGQSDRPLATLAGARDAIRRLKKAGPLPAGGVRVEIHAGRYELAKPLELGTADSGTPAAPIVYQGAKGQPKVICGGRRVKDFRPVTDPAVLARLEPGARGKVLQASLPAQGITDYGRADGSGLGLYFQDRPMTVARWPNEGFVRIVGLVGGNPVDVRGTKGDHIGKFYYDGDRPNRWQAENDAWLHGYWFWDWADQRQPLESIDTRLKILAVKPPYHSYGYRKGQWYYAFNLLAELDSPGEWYLDRTSGILYFWPPAAIGSSPATVTLLENHVTLKGTSNLTLRGFQFEIARATAIVGAGCTDVRVDGCTIRNVGNAAAFSGGQRCGVANCQIERLARGGISLSGGDRKSLTPCGHYAENNHIHDYGRWARMYSAAVSINGVGIRVAHNLIHDAPHQAISFSGNDHTIELNEIHNVCHESNDAGAIYAGRNWTMRGTVIRYNYMHHLFGHEGRGCVGVYLDDMFCGTRIFGNVFYRVPRPAFIGGGRDCTVENNIFVECVPAIHVDARMLGWAGTPDSQEGMRRSLAAMPYQTPPWSQRYPELPKILDDEPAAPKGNVIQRNVCWGGKWDGMQAKARPYVALRDNLVDEDPHFVDAAKLNFQLRDDSPAYRKIGFQRIPVEKIGLHP